MCESNAYKTGPDGETLLMKDVNKMEPAGDGQWKLETVLGEEILVDGKLLAIDFGAHKIVIESK